MELASKRGILFSAGIKSRITMNVARGCEVGV